MKWSNLIQWCAFYFIYAAVLFYLFSLSAHADELDLELFPEYEQAILPTDEGIYQQIGPFIFDDKGNYWQQLGPFTLGSDGSSCTRVGKTTFCTGN